MNKKEYEAISNLVMLELNTIHNVSSLKDLIDDEKAILPTLYELQKEGLIEIVTHDEQGFPLTWKITRKGMDVKYIHGGYEKWDRKRCRMKVVAGIVRALLIGGIVFIVCRILMK